MMSSKKMEWGFLIFLFLAILPYYYLSFFAQPFLDDFAYAHQFQKNNYLHLVGESYLKLNGRYVSNFLIYLNPISFNSFSSYIAFPIIFLGLTFVAIRSFIKNLLQGISPIRRTTFALVVTLLFLLNLPNISEEIYWFTGGVIYHMSLVSVLYYLGSLIRFLNGDYIVGRRVHMVILFLLLFISEGFNEVLTITLVMILAIMVATSFIQQLRCKKHLLFQFIFSVLFAFLLILSPGNSIRGTYYPGSHDFIHSTIYSILQTIRFSGKWILSPTLLLVSLVYIMLYLKELKKQSIFAKSFYLNRWVSLFLLFFSIFICVFPPYWATGILGQHRTVNVASFFFLMMWFINLSVWINSIKKGLGNFVFKTRYAYCIKGLFMLSLLFWGNGWFAIKDIFTGKAAQFKTQMEHRHRELFNAKHTPLTIIELEPITARPQCLFISDITNDPNYWTNRAYNDYFELESTEIFLAK